MTGSWRPNINCNILTPTLMPVSVVSFLCSRCSTGGPEAHSAGWWLSLLHLISNFSGPQTPSGFPRAPSAGRGFLYHTRLPPSPTLLQLPVTSVLIVQRPLDLWNSMFDHHQAEITVMQFTGALVWVYHGNFFNSSHFISQFPPARFPLITAIRMCHLLPVHHLGMAFLAGSKVKI